jgi:hypothetical protein
MREHFMALLRSLSAGHMIVAEWALVKSSTVLINDLLFPTSLRL